MIINLWWHDLDSLLIYTAILLDEDLLLGSEEIYFREVRPWLKTAVQLKRNRSPAAKKTQSRVLLYGCMGLVVRLSQLSPARPWSRWLRMMVWMSCRCDWGPAPLNVSAKILASLGSWMPWPSMAHIVAGASRRCIGSWQKDCAEPKVAKSSSPALVT